MVSAWLASVSASSARRWSTSLCRPTRRLSSSAIDFFKGGFDLAEPVALLVHRLFELDEPGIAFFDLVTENTKALPADHLQISNLVLQVNDLVSGLLELDLELRLGVGTADALDAHGFGQTSDPAGQFGIPRRLQQLQIFVGPLQLELRRRHAPQTLPAGRQVGAKNIYPPGEFVFDPREGRFRLVEVGPQTNHDLIVGPQFEPVPDRGFVHGLPRIREVAAKVEHQRLVPQQLFLLPAQGLTPPLRHHFEFSDPLLGVGQGLLDRSQCRVARVELTPKLT